MSIERIDGCIGCGTCVSTCPTDVLRMSANGRRAEIRWAEDCQVCHLCQVYCPVDAITVTDQRAVVPVMTAWG